MQIKGKVSSITVGGVMGEDIFSGSVFVDFAWGWGYAFC